MFEFIIKSETRSDSSTVYSVCLVFNDNESRTIVGYSKLDKLDNYLCLTEITTQKKCGYFFLLTLFSFAKTINKEIIIERYSSTRDAVYNLFDRALNDAKVKKTKLGNHYTDMLVDLDVESELYSFYNKDYSFFSDFNLVPVTLGNETIQSIELYQVINAFGDIYEQSDFSNVFSDFFTFNSKILNHIDSLL